MVDYPWKYPSPTFTFSPKIDENNSCNNVFYIDNQKLVCVEVSNLQGFISLPKEFLKLNINSKSRTRDFTMNAPIISTCFGVINDQRRRRHITTCCNQKYTYDFFHMQRRIEWMILKTVFLKI